MEKVFDCCVIGAGVVGASICNKMTRIGKSCLLIDKASDVATGASKANSGIVHAGYDPKPDSLMAKLNVRGNKLFPSICKRLSVKICKCGSLVVGDDKEKIQSLYERGLQNKVKVQILDKKALKDKVPVLNDGMSTALFAPNAYIVSPYLFTIALTDEAILNGAVVSLEEDLVSVKKQKNLFVIKTKKNTFKAKYVINSAGAGYNDVAEILGTEKYDIHFRRGEYFVFDKTADLKVPCIIFPLPTKLGKGVLVTPTVDGNWLVGPTSEESDTVTKTTQSGLASVREKSTILVNLNFKNAIRQFSGIRAICGDDFVICRSEKVDGVINLAGICSPGLTSAPAIAEMVATLCGYDLAERNDLKILPKYEMFKDMSSKKQKEALKNDKTYSQVVCKCEQITKGDIQTALSRPLKIHSVDGIKRRTNAGMGRCQGGFCFSKVVQNIADAREIPFEAVLKENRGSEVAVGDIREVK